MSIPFDPKELEITGYQKGFNPALPGTPLFSFPIPSKDNYKALLADHKGNWMPYGVETGVFCPSIIPDNIARAFVFEGKPWGKPYDKHPNMFGINWIFVPTVGGSMEDPAYPHPLEDVNDWKEIIKFPDPESWDWDASAALNKDYLNNGKNNMFWFLNGMGFERLISFMGFENAAMALIDEDQEDALHELLSALTDLHIKIADLAIEAYGDGIGGFCVHDDWGSQKAPFFSFAAGKEFFVPEWKRFTSHIKAKGKLADLHSCGHVETQIENFIEGGWQSWTPMAMNDTHALYEKYGDKMVIGVVAPKWDPKGTEEEQYEAGKAFAEKFYRPNKSAAYSLYTGIPITDAYARGMYEASRKLS